MRRCRIFCKNCPLFPRRPSTFMLQRYSNPAEYEALDPHVSCHECNLLHDTVMEDESDVLFVPGDFLIEPVVSFPMTDVHIVLQIRRSKLRFLAFQCGNVQPYSSRKCIIIFSPYKPEEYEAFAYCDVTGNEDRVMVTLCGRGIEPKFTFGFDENFVPLPIASAQNNQVSPIPTLLVLNIILSNSRAVSSFI